MPANQTSIITVSVDSSRLNPLPNNGFYRGTVRITAGNTVREIRVTVTVNGVTITASPNQITSTLQVGQTRTQNVAVTGGPSNVLVSTAGGQWLQANDTNAPGTLVVRLDSSNLATGQYQGSVTLACAGGSPCVPVAIAVSLTVIQSTLAPSPTSFTFQATAGRVTPAQTLTVRSSDGTVLPYGAGGSHPWLRLSTGTANATQAGSTIAVSVDATSLAVGTHTGSVSLTCGGAIGCPGVNIPVTVVVGQTSGPVIKQAGVITAGAFGASATLGPGTYIELFGAGLAQTTREWAGADFVNNTAPTTLDGVRLTINNQPAFLRFISPDQVNALVPASAGTGSVEMVLANANGSSAPYRVTIDPLKPGVLAPPALQVNGRQYIAGLFSDGAFAMPAGSIAGVNSHPAVPGARVVFYGIGFGSVDPDVPVGRIAPGQLTSLRSPLQILFGDTPAVIEYQGLAAGFVGLYQFNVVVPAVPDNDAVQLTFIQGGQQLAQRPFIAVRR